MMADFNPRGHTRLSEPVEVEADLIGSPSEDKLATGVGDGVDERRDAVIRPFPALGESAPTVTAADLVRRVWHLVGRG